MRHDPPVVLVVFDALPVRLLEDATGHIDSERFPNFASLAHAGTWYRNATTIHESTRFSVPAILDGKRPRPGVPETVQGHPRNLFTSLGRRYRMNVWEEATSLCPRTLCRPHGPGNVIWRIKHGRIARFRGAIAKISAGPRPQLSFIHVLLPHEPRQYLPDGRAYARELPSEPSLEPPDYFHRKFLVQEELQRELLQLEFTDKLLGELIARVKRVGIWNSALLAVVSDHGESFDVKRRPAAPFRLGQLNWHRAVTRHNLKDIAGVALFVKYPGERSGGTDNRFVRTVDLLPTILGAAHAPRSGLWGRSLRDPRYRGHDEVRVWKQQGGSVAMPVRRWLARAAQSQAHRIRLFGTGTHSLYAFGPHQDVLGRSVADLPRARRSALHASVYRAKLYSHVELHGSFIPAHVSGWLRGARPAGRILAFALNGTIVATAPSYPALGASRINFSAMLPEDGFVQGRNSLAVYELTGSGVTRL